jgi:hypothetical protein
MNRKVNKGNALHPVHRPPRPPPNSNLISVPVDSTMMMSATAFPLVRPYMVGATGFEPVSSSMSAKPREPLCYTPFSQVSSDHRLRRETLS